MIGTAKHTETNEQLVVYEHIYPHERALFVRPESMFNETLPDGTRRFTPVEELDVDVPEEPVGTVTDQTFEKDVLQATGVVIVKFGAQWCGPCKMLAPALESVSKEYVGKITIKDMDVDANVATAAKYGVRGIPQMTAFFNGKPVLNVVGARSQSQLRTLFDRLLGEYGVK